MKLTVVVWLSLFFSTTVVIADIAKDEERAALVRHEGMRHFAVDEHGQAIRKFEEALRIERTLGHRDHEADALELIGCLQVQEEAYELAADKFSRATDIWRQLKRPVREAFAMTLGAFSWAGSAGKSGSEPARKEAERLRSAATLLCAGGCDAEGTIEVRTVEGVVLTTFGAPDSAERIWARVMRDATAVGDMEAARLAQKLLAAQRWALHDYEAAAPLYLAVAETTLKEEKSGDALRNMDDPTDTTRAPIGSIGGIAVTGVYDDPKPQLAHRTHKLNEKQKVVLAKAADEFEVAAVCFRAIRQPLDESSAWDRVLEIHLGLVDKVSALLDEQQLMHVYRRLGNAEAAHRFELTGPITADYEPPQGIAAFIDLGWIMWSRDLAVDSDETNGGWCQAELGLPLDVAETQICLSQKQLARGKFDAAIERLTKVRDQSRKKRLRRPEASASLELGIAYLLVRNPRQALQELTRSYELLKDHRSSSDLGVTLTALASAYGKLGNYSASLRSAIESITVLEGIGDRRNVATAYATLATTYANAGDVDHGMEWFTRAETAYKDIDEYGGAANAAAGEVQIYLARKDFTAAVKACDRVLAFAPKIKPDQPRSTDAPHIRLWLLKSKALAAIGDIESARKTYATVSVEGINVPELRIESRIVKALIEQLSGNSTTAIAAADEALKLSEEAYLADYVVEIQELRGSVLEKQSPANALVAYQAALRSLTQIRDSLDVPDLKLSFASRTAKLYEHVFSLLIADGRDVEAFDLVEKARARTFLDQLARTDAIPAGRAAGQFDETLQLRRAISTLEAEARVSGNQLTADELRKRRESYAALLKRVHAVGPASRAESAGPLQSDAIRKALDADTTLVAYYLTASESHAFVLTRTSPPMRVKLPLVPADLDRTIRTLHDFASVTSAREIEMLSDALIAPILPQLKTRRLVIVPFGSLHYVPFAALKVSTAQVLADRFELVELPAASVLPLLSAGGELKTMFVIGAADVDGLPSLKDTKGMLHRVAAKFGTTPLTGAAATEEAFWSGSSSADILFVMAHGKLQADAPLFSRFYLAPSAREDGLIEIQELQNRRISARLVVLGACQTQLGATTAGDDVVALNRAFLASGASAVVATLWRVPKQASEMLLETFFLRIHAGDAPAAALQAAQRRVREEEQYADPYYWAGFVLNGYS